jgi:glycosyltransferase involved in cell wall biosynthesis
MADCLICSFKRSPVYQYGVSMNKLCDYLMSGRPVILSGESAYDPVAEGGAGYSVPAEDPRALAEALVTMADLPPEQRRAMGQRGIAWVKRHHDVRLLADRLEGILLPRSEPEGALT